MTENIKQKLKSKDYEFLRDNENLGNNILLLGLSGSYAYADIVTTLATNFLSEMYFVGQITFVISAVVIFILGILFIIKKG